MKRLAMILALVCCGAGMATEVRGEWLVDGPWVEGDTSGIGGDGKIAVKLVVDRETAIESIEARMTTHRDSVDVDPSQGNWQWAIYSSGTDNWPSQRLMYKSFYAPESPAGQRLFDWRGIRDTGWTLDSGEYWAVLENIEGVPASCFVQGTTNRLLAPRHEFASYDLVGDPELGQIPVLTWRPSTGSNYSNFAIRIAGHTVPEPSGLNLAGMALTFLVFKKKSHGGAPRLHIFNRHW